MFSHDVIRTAEDGLHRECWSFRFNGSWRTTLYVSGYCRQTRQSKRHKWKRCEPFFDLSMDQRTFTPLSPSEVPVPADVRLEARDAFMAHLSFTISHPAHSNAVRLT